MIFNYFHQDESCKFIVHFDIREEKEKAQKLSTIDSTQVLLEHSRIAHTQTQYISSTEYS